jgi:F0F1-type ATP synthase membrane subunit b/b'
MLLKTLFISLMLVSSNAYAAGGGIPMAFIKLQIMNFIVFGLVIFFISRSKIAPVFKQIKDDYVAKAEAAKIKLEQAKIEKDELAHKLESLELGFEANLEKADQDARNLYKTKILEAKDSVSSLHRDLETQIEGLKRSHSNKIKSSLMEQSIEALKSDLGADVDEKLLIQLQEQFVKTMDVRV